MPSGASTNPLEPRSYRKGHTEDYQGMSYVHPYSLLRVPTVLLLAEQANSESEGLEGVPGQAVLGPLMAMCSQSSTPASDSPVLRPLHCLGAYNAYCITGNVYSQRDLRLKAVCWEDFKVR
jgi:hypothetical protein